MKKLVLLGMALFMAACPVACVDDPTESDTTCVEVSDSTDAVDACVVDSTESVEGTSTETVVE